MRIFTILSLVFVSLAGVAKAENLQTAIFAGGCFWCVESDFDQLSGVVSTTSGYTGGDVANVSYRQVVAGGTGHYEAVKIVFDADVITYSQMLHAFWRSVDPTDAGGQFCDRGPSYRTAIFALNAEQAAQAETSKAGVRLSAPVVTPILTAGDFWDAEGYHQNYHNTHSLKYGFYRSRCGRDARVTQLWGDEAMFAH